MNQQNIQMFIAQNSKMFEPYQLQQITNQLLSVDDGKVMMINSASYKDPTTMLIVSLFLGGLGIDRFMIGDTGIGVLKLLTGGCFGILTIIDWFTIQKKAKEKNFQIFQETLQMAYATTPMPPYQGAQQYPNQNQQYQQNPNNYNNY